MNDPLALFAACLPGLEPLLAAEIERLELAPPRPVDGGVELRTDARGLFRANLELGLASHVLLRLAAFGARSLGELVRKTAQLPWEEWIPPHVQPVVRATCRRSRLYHSGAVQQRVEEGIAARLGSVPGSAAGAASEPPPESQPEVGVLVRFDRDHCTLSLDTSGAPLHRRGWRDQPGAAPVREDLARALVAASGWDPATPLLDPMAGVGTIPIEAAGLALGLAPGRLRSFAFEHTALFDAGLWREVRAAAEGRRVPPSSVRVLGSDRDARALAAAQTHAERAGVAGVVELRRAALSEAADFGGDAPPRGAVVTHPPFGRRLGPRTDLAPLYRALGQLLQRLPPRWRAALLAADRRLALRSGLALETAFLTDHGGLKVRALVGGRRRPRGGAGACG